MAKGLSPGTQAADFTLLNGKGQPVKLIDYRGKNVVLAFYPADWSPVCTSELALIQETLGEIRDYNAEVLGVSVDGHWSHGAWAERLHLTLPLLADFWPHGQVATTRYGGSRAPYGGMARPRTEGLRAANPETIRLVSRHFPVTTVPPHALMAAEAAAAAGAQGQFWEMHNMILAHQSHLAYDTLRACAVAIGLDVARFGLEMEEHVHLPQVRLDFRRGVRDGVNGTPTIFINRLRYDGPRDHVSMLAAIVAARKAAHGRVRGPA